MSGCEGNTRKHAFLIMAHHRPDLLTALIEALDDTRNDIYLHIDAKSLSGAGEKGDSFMDPAKFRTEKSNLTIIPSMEVNWGGYSQIECTLRLLDAAVSGGPYAYYHLLTGATFPLKNMDEIHRFFEEKEGREFIDFSEPKFSRRVRYIYLFNECGKKVEELGILRTALRGGFLALQKILGLDRFRKYGMPFKKGLAYWSITDDLAHYILSKKDLIKSMMRHSECGDEIFLQTLVWSSSFKDRLYNPPDCETSCRSGSMRLSTWPIEDAGEERPGHSFIAKDLPLLMQSDALFALKFEGEDGLDIIEKLSEKM